MATLSSGDPNCANGGASIADGSGKTAFACNGAPGPEGPPGAASSLDELNGVPCQNGAGNTAVNYDSSGNVAIQCVIPPSGPPGSSAGNPINLGTFQQGNALTCNRLPITESGTAGSGRIIWYQYEVDPSIVGNCKVRVALTTGAVTTGNPGVAFDAYFVDTGTAVGRRLTAFTVFSNSDTPANRPFFIDVRALPSTQTAANYTLTWTAVPCPCTESGPYS